MAEENKKRPLEETNGTDTIGEETNRESKIPKTDVTEKKVSEDETKIESKDDDSSEKSKPKPTPFVFGSTTSFGQMGGFKMFGSKGNVFSKPEKNDEKKESDEEKPKTEEKDEKEVESSNNKPIFGSGSAFGNAFQAAINQKSVFDDLKPTEGSKGSKENEESEEKETNGDVYKTVHLEKQDVKSGEENEETLFQIKAKLYHMELSNAKEGWKERGFGVIKVNKFKESPAENYTARIVMRQNGNLKLILNVPIVKDFKILKGMPSSLTGNKFVRLQMIEGGEPVQYAIKIGQPENAEKFFDTVEEQIPGKSSVV